MKKDRVKKAVLVIVGLIIFTIAYYIFYKITNIGLPCVFHEFFGFYCPGCGITRMIFSIMQLDLYQAFRYDALMFIFTPFAIVLAIDWLIGYLYDRPNKIFSKIPFAVWITVLVISVIFGIIRNIGPFTYLAPTTIVDGKEIRE